MTRSKILRPAKMDLPEPPQLADFDQSLQDYKIQIEAELEQEAAAAGLTVEEYVASDYEAPAQPNFSIYLVPPGPEGRDFRYRSYEDLREEARVVRLAHLLPPQRHIQLLLKRRHRFR